jgi:hypothetical protein
VPAPTLPPWVVGKLIVETMPSVLGTADGEALVGKGLMTIVFGGGIHSYL